MQKQHYSRRATPWDDTSDKTPLQEFLIQHYQQSYEIKHPSLADTQEAVLINSFVPNSCPHCGSQNIRKYGHTKNGVQRYQCLICNKTFTPITGTIFDNHKIAISEWIEYVLNLLRYISINADSWNNRNAYATSRYWLQKIFLVLENYQKSIVLSERVWLDETYYSVRKRDLSLSPSGTKLRGISKNQMCIGVACDKDRVVCYYEGTGKPSKKKTYALFADHIVSGSTLIHDKESAHNMIVNKLKLKEEIYDSRTLKGLPDKENPLNRVNQVHARLKDFLNAHSGFNRESLQGYLNLFSFAMNPPYGYLEKVDEMLSIAFQMQINIKYRDYYVQNIKK